MFNFSGSSLDWDLVSRNIGFVNNEGEIQPIPNKVAVVRSDNSETLGIVSDGYNILQNKSLYEKIQPMVEEGLLTVENIGDLRGGRDVYIQAQLVKEYRVVGESYRGFISLTNNHGGKASAGLGCSCVRIVCENTFAQVNSEIDRFRHIGEGVQKFLDSAAVYDFVDEQMGIYAKHAEKLATSPCSAGAFHDFLAKVYKKEEVAKIRNVEKLNDLFYNGRGNEGRTFYDAFNAVTELNSHFTRKTAQGQFNYANFGEGSRLNSRAMAAALELA